MIAYYSPAARCTTMETKTFSVVVVGDRGCGKTTYLNSIQNRCTISAATTTPTTKNVVLPVETVLGRTFNINIHDITVDTPNQLKLLKNINWINIDGALVFIDVSVKNGEKNLLEWIYAIRVLNPTKISIPVIVCGNKSDLGISANYFVINAMSIGKISNVFEWWLISSTTDKHIYKPLVSLISCWYGLKERYEPVVVGDKEQTEWQDGSREQFAKSMLEHDDLLSPEKACGVISSTTEPASVSIEAPLINEETSPAPPLPATKTPLPATEPPLPAAEPPLPAAEPPLPATKTPLPATKTPLPATKTSLPATKPPLPATKPPLPAAKTPPPAPPLEPMSVPTKIAPAPKSIEKNGNANKLFNIFMKYVFTLMTMIPTHEKKIVVIPKELVFANTSEGIPDYDILQEISNRCCCAPVGVLPDGVWCAVRWRLGEVLEEYKIEIVRL